jgi:hypothetical protein
MERQGVGDASALVARAGEHDKTGVQVEAVKIQPKRYLQCGCAAVLLVDLLVLTECPETEACGVPKAHCIDLTKNILARSCVLALAHCCCK